MQQAALIGEHPAVDQVEQDARDWLLAAKTALQWAHSAIAAYDFLTGKTASRERRGYQDSVMNLRAYLIARLGAIPGDRILNTDDLIFYFFDGLSLTLDEVRDKAHACKERLRDRDFTPRLTHDLQLLRGLKNRLGPLALVVESGQLEPSPVLREWLEIRGQLP
jgi:hypothetical protein